METQGAEGHLRMEGEIEGMCPQAMEHQELPSATTSQQIGKESSESPEGSKTADTLLQISGLQNCENNFCCIKPPNE